MPPGPSAHLRKRSNDAGVPELVGFLDMKNRNIGRNAGTTTTVLRRNTDRRSSVKSRAAGRSEPVRPATGMNGTP